MLNTIGYEGADPADFLRTLQMAGVSLVIDIRDRAQSRRPGFSKTALESNLQSAGIAYAHFKELGDPKEGRDAARANDIAKFKRIFGAVLASPDAQTALQRIADATTRESVCLLCYERDPAHCHRTLVADRVEALTGMATRHLGVRRFESDDKLAG